MRRTIKIVRLVASCYLSAQLALLSSSREVGSGDGQALDVVGVAVTLASVRAALG
jgi:hypothetical protein